jgi:hypothetical protein
MKWVHQARLDLFNRKKWQALTNWKTTAGDELSTSNHIPSKETDRFAFTINYCY